MPGCGEVEEVGGPGNQEARQACLLRRPKTDPPLQGPGLSSLSHRASLVS